MNIPADVGLDESSADLTMFPRTESEERSHVPLDGGAYRGMDRSSAS
jgi:hypothetical protein